MHDHIVPKLPKWPFFLGDALLLGLAFFVCYQSGLPLSRVEIAACVVSVAFGATLGVLPFLSEYRAVLKIDEAENLAGVVGQIKNIEQVAAQISTATSLWQNAQDAADKTTQAAAQIADGMTAELKNFSEFMERAGESEKATLRLEVEKARRAEGEWLQIMVRLLDHVFALHTAAVRSGQPNVIKQIDGFQTACRDTVRRVGLVPFLATPDEPFDEKRHQVIEDDAKPAPGALVAETLATGYTFQSQLLRPAIVRLQVSAEVAATDVAEEPLPLESAT